jgi:hypothetical protein
LGVIKTVPLFSHRKERSLSDKKKAAWWLWLAFCAIGPLLISLGFISWQWRNSLAFSRLRDEVESAGGKVSWSTDNEFLTIDLSDCNISPERFSQISKAWARFGNLRGRKLRFRVDLSGTSEIGRYIEYLDEDVIAIDLSDTDLNDEELAMVMKRCPSVGELFLEGTDVTTECSELFKHSRVFFVDLRRTGFQRSQAASLSRELRINVEY